MAEGGTVQGIKPRFVNMGFVISIDKTRVPGAFGHLLGISVLFCSETRTTVKQPQALL